MSCDSPLPSPLHQLSIPSSLVIFPHFLFPSTPPVLPLPPPAPPFLPVCSSFQACQSGSGEKSLRMPNLTKCSLHTQRVAVEMGSDLPKLDLLTVSLTLFIIPSLYRGPLFSPVLLFPLCPTVNLIFPPTSKPIRCLLCKTLMTDLLE